MENEFKNIADFICKEVKQQREDFEKCETQRNILADAMAEVKVINDKIKNKELAEIIDGCIDELTT